MFFQVNNQSSLAQGGVTATTATTSNSAVGSTAAQRWGREGIMGWSRLVALVELIWDGSASNQFGDLSQGKLMSFSPPQKRSKTMLRTN